MMYDVLSADVHDHSPRVRLPGGPLQQVSSDGHGGVYLDPHHTSGLLHAGTSSRHIIYLLTCFIC